MHMCLPCLHALAWATCTQPPTHTHLRSHPHAWRPPRPPPPPGERVLAAELRGIGLTQNEIPEWKKAAMGQAIQYGIQASKRAHTPVRGTGGRVWVWAWAGALLQALQTRRRPLTTTNLAHPRTRASYSPGALVFRFPCLLIPAPCSPPLPSFPLCALSPSPRPFGPQGARSIKEPGSNPHVLAIIIIWPT